MSQPIYVYGGSFNPPGEHHWQVVEELSHLGTVIVVPCGFRSDKASTNEVSPCHRLRMTELAFGGIHQVYLDHYDLLHRTFTPTWRLQERYQRFGKVIHVIGSDLIQGGKDGQSPIQTTWQQGTEIWSKLHFLVLPRPEFPLDPLDLPPHATVHLTDIYGSSSEIRAKIAQGQQPPTQMLSPRVAAYVFRHQLYQKGGPHAHLTA